KYLYTLVKPYPIVIKPFGDFAILVEWPQQVEESILNDILQFVGYLKNQDLKKEDWEMVPAYNSLLLVNNKNHIDFISMKNQIENWYSSKEDVPLPQKYLWKLPVCYDTEFGIDLEEVASTLGLEIPELIDLHV